MRNLKRVLSLVLALMMALSLMAFTGSASAAESTTISVAADKYSDYDQATPAYKEAVDVVTALEIIQGVKAGSGETLSPDVTLDRAQATAILARMMLGVEQAETMDGVNASTGFSDVANDHYAANYIAYCANQGIISGTGAGTFLPEVKLSGVAFGKMLLVALGYNAEKEGLTGNNWTTNVAVTLANAGIELRDGDGNLVDLTQDLTREQAMEMTFQALQTPLVEYPTMTISQSAIATKNGASYVTSNVAQNQNISSKSLSSTNIANTIFLVEFAEKYFQKLLLNDTVDAFGRPTHTWVLNNITIDTYDDYDLLVAEYDSEVDDVTVSGDLANYYMPVNDDTAQAMVIRNKRVVPANNYTKYGPSGSGNVDGVDTPAENTNDLILYRNTATKAYLPLGYKDTDGTHASTLADTIAHLTGNGRKVEIYVDKDYENVVNNIVVIDYAVGTLNIVRPVTNDRTNYAVTNAKWTAQGGTSPNYITTLTGSEFDNENVKNTVVYYDGAKTGDVVTCAKIDSVLYIYPTTDITGVQDNITSVLTGTRDTYKVTISGEEYTLGTAVDKVDPSDFSNNRKNSATYYLDQYGYVVYSDKANLSYAYIVAAGGGVRPGPEGNVPNIVVRAVLEDGTANEYNLAVEKKNGNWYIKGTNYQINVDNDSTAKKSAEDWLTDTEKTKSPAGFTVWDYNIEENTAGSDTITLYSLNTIEDSNFNSNPQVTTKGTVAVGTANTGVKITNGTTSVNVKSGTGDITNLFLNYETVFVIYNQATQKATVKTGNTSLTGYELENAKLVAIANGSGTVVSYLVFATVNKAEETSVNTDYVYIDTTKGTTTMSNGTIQYTAYTSKGEAIYVTDEAGVSGTGSKIVKATGIYLYDVDTNKITEQVATADHGNATYLQGGEVKVAANGLLEMVQSHPEVKQPINIGSENAVYVDVEKGHENGAYAFIVKDNNNTIKTVFVVPEPAGNHTASIYTVKIGYPEGEKTFTGVDDSSTGKYTASTNVTTARGVTEITVTVTCDTARKTGADTITVNASPAVSFKDNENVFTTTTNTAKGSVVGSVTFTVEAETTITLTVETAATEIKVSNDTDVDAINNALKDASGVAEINGSTSGVTLPNDKAIEIPANTTLKLTGNVTIPADTEITGEGTVTVAGDVTTASAISATVEEGGTLKSSANLSGETVTLNGGTLELGANGTLPTLGATGTGGTVKITSGTTTISSAVSADYAVTVAKNATATVSAKVSDLTVEDDATAAVSADVSNLTVKDGATVNISGGETTVQNGIGAGTEITVTGEGKLVINGDVNKDATITVADLRKITLGDDAGKFESVVKLSEDIGLDAEMAKAAPLGVPFYAAEGGAGDYNIQDCTVGVNWNTGTLAEDDKVLEIISDGTRTYTYTNTGLDSNKDYLTMFDLRNPIGAVDPGDNGAWDGTGEYTDFANGGSTLTITVKVVDKDGQDVENGTLVTFSMPNPVKTTATPST